MCSHCSTHELRIKLGTENMQGYAAELQKNPGNEELQVWLKHSQEYLDKVETIYQRHRQKVHGERFTS